MNGKITDQVSLTNTKVEMCDPSKCDPCNVLQIFTVALHRIRNCCASNKVFSCSYVTNSQYDATFHTANCPKKTFIAFMPHKIFRTYFPC